MEAGDGKRPPLRIRHVGLLSSEAFRIAVVSIPRLPARLADFCLFDSIFLDPSRLLHGRVAPRLARFQDRFFQTLTHPRPI